MLSTVKWLTHRYGLDVFLHMHTLKFARESEVKVWISCFPLLNCNLLTYRYGFVTFCTHTRGNFLVNHKLKCELHALITYGQGLDTLCTHLDENLHTFSIDTMITCLTMGKDLTQICIRISRNLIRDPLG